MAERKTGGAYRFQVRLVALLEAKAAPLDAQLHDINLALRSGLPRVVPWALNIIGLASFQARL